MARINYYVAVFIDILGQGDKLASVKHLPLTEEGREELLAIFRETAGYVRRLHHLFDEIFKGYETITPDIQVWLDSVSPEVRGQFEESRKLNLQSLYFSDTVVLYFTLDKEKNKTPIRSLYNALSSAAISFLIMMSKGIPLRGAINIGIATEIERSGIYGPILHNLHHLESKEAKYPRIIIGQELIQMMKDFEREQTVADDYFKVSNQEALAHLYPLITTDSDGHSILHYLDKSIAESMGPERKEVYRGLQSFVERQYREVNGCDDEEKRLKLRSRYKLLKDYVRRNKAPWN
ncbi:hypothetical protein WCX49_09990 [Sulfurimonas sp. HSL-1656]|uniref:hypothetical protein n=1 Tax=Thiomicrolovo subterrani TaxID=3131934 RepID=UPI0031F9C1E7